MKKITMFTMKSCPYCRAALGCMEELFAENPGYRALEIENIDEVVHPDIAKRYDYYYVPSYYVENQKLHEGAASLEIIRQVFNAALEE